jgi:hypothetical protein
MALVYARLCAVIAVAIAIAMLIADGPIGPG